MIDLTVRDDVCGVLRTIHQVDTGSEVVTELALDADGGRVHVTVLRRVPANLIDRRIRVGLSEPHGIEVLDDE